MKHRRRGAYSLTLPLAGLYGSVRNELVCKSYILRLLRQLTAMAFLSDVVKRGPSFRGEGCSGDEKYRRGQGLPL